MKRVPIYIAVALLTFALGVIITFRISNINPRPRAMAHSQPISAGLRPEMFEVIHSSNEPLKIVNIRLAQEDSATSDILIEVENISSRKIAYFKYQLELFNDCADSSYSGHIISPPNGTSNYPLDMALKPKQKETLRFRGNSYPAYCPNSAPNERTPRDCESHIRAKLYLSMVVFSDLTRWDQDKNL